MNEDDKFIDLHESQWERTGKRQPFWGENAGYFLCMFLASFPIYTIAHLIVTGEAPYFLRHLLE